VVDLGTSELTGYEALIRWQRPGHGLIAPDRFIPTAERSALVCDLGRWVLHEATGQLARWIAADPQRFARTTVAVNISGRHLMSPALLDDVTDALAHSGLRPDQLVLEITETVLVDEPLAVARMRALRDLGVCLSIDDFGTGYTSIGQLQHLSVDVLKIDRSFVGSTAPGARELVLLMVTAAHAIGLHVVAEGVETDEQLLPLQQMGCDSVQGYLFARPQPAEAISAEQSAEHVADVRP
jgi:EAL domain-containing protein (putative c-di-GMP-specific phosphodiesterase class I)